MESDSNVRQCGTCACFARIKQDGTVSSDPKEQAQPSCRRIPPQLAQLRMEVPVVDKFGNPIRYTDGKMKGEIRREFQNVPVLIYGGTKEEAVCFDGWRPIGTLPGEDWDKRPRKLSTAV